MPTDTPSYDVVIVGGGHNGLTAAAYLAKAGKTVLLLERLAHTGGAAVSAVAFEGVPARLSRYSYLVSLLPQAIVDDLGLDLKLARRRYSSYTPVPGHAAGAGLLVDGDDPAATRASFARIGAPPADADAFATLYADTARLARALWPTVTQPLPRRAEVRARLADDALWAAVFERPIGELIEARVAHDVVRGVVATDALIGLLAAPHDPDLAQNRCFLYHVIGGGTGDWDVPIGGMGTVTDQLAGVARAAGARLLTGAEVTAVRADGTVRYTTADGLEHSVVGGHVLSNVALYVLGKLLGQPEASLARPEGAQVKVNLLLKRLPKLRDGAVSPEAAFGGTFHINETYSQLAAAHASATAGVIPAVVPCEIYCHSLTDASILGPELAAAGAHTLTVFALQVPDRLLGAANSGSDDDAQRERLQAAVLASLNSVLAEPIEEVLLADGHGRPCVETKTTRDLEAALGMPGGHIFHGPLSWPFAEDDDPLDTPGRRWGVATPYGPRILLCGAGAVRGGAVSGLGGHNAAMAVLEATGSGV